MPMDGTMRRRVTRACDECRKTKSKCEYSSQSKEPCRNCLFSGIECTFLEPTHKRGPPKGYLSALEQRLHDAEALLGVIISLTDQRATTLIADLSTDLLAQSIITRITNSGFGPVGKAALRRQDSVPDAPIRSIDSRQQHMNDPETPTIDSNGHLVFAAPCHMWQDYLVLRLSLESRLRAQAPQKSLSHDGPSSVPLEAYREPHPTRLQIVVDWLYFITLVPTALELSGFRNALQFPVSDAPDGTEPIPMQVDVPTENISSLPPPKANASQDATESEESDDTASTLLDLDGAAEGQKEYIKAISRNLGRLLDLDDGACGSPYRVFDMHHSSYFPLDIGKPWVEKLRKDKDEDGDAWPGDVIEARDTSLSVSANLGATDLSAMVLL